MEKATRTVALTVRFAPEDHQAVSVAAARANLSVSTWVAQVATAASHVANAHALVGELEGRQISSRAVREELVEKALELLRLGLENTGSQVADASDVFAKLSGVIESMVGAEKIRRGGD